MIFTPPLREAVLVRRYQRFLADVLLPDGAAMTIHCPNTGSMKHCAPQGARVLYSDSGNPARKYRHTLEAVQVAHGHWAGVNTGRSNALVAEAVAAGRVPGLEQFSVLRREVRRGDSRFDLMLEGVRPTWVEVKNVTLGPGPDEDDHGTLAFPDAVTVRGQKHLRTLMDVAASGERAVLFFCVQHTGAARVRPADDIDPEYGRLLREAVRAGVEVLAWRTRIAPTEFVLERPLPVQL